MEFNSRSVRRGTLPSPRELDPASSIAALFGTELRRVRISAKLSQEALGEVLGYTGSLVGQVETARRSPTLEFAERLDGALETGGLFSRLWPHVVRGPFPDYFKTYAGLEPKASEIFGYFALLIPGLGQTEEYMWEVFQSALPLASDADIESKVAARLSRMDLMAGPTRPVLWWLIDEAALRRPVGGPAVMARQLRHLAHLIRSRVVLVQALPYASGAHAALEGSLTLLSFADGSPDVAYIEGPHSGVLVESTDTVRKIRLTYDLARSEKPLLYRSRWTRVRLRKLGRAILSPAVHEDR
ncbi:Scr1 family TA system antitoxin-like transcriptional regulator, partial [Kitasatospora sp. NPDC088134]|uniref:helix-turn-helix domain-containing protein n=1 Tax=Kitasatospora sp. NPDC088134 TaxID=3364071 RepID=UPI0038008DF9